MRSWHLQWHGSSSPNTKRQLVREARLYRGHGSERFPEVGPRQRVERLGVDEIIRRFAAPQLLHLMIEAQREDEAERLDQRARIPAVQRPGRLGRAEPADGRAARDARGHPGPAREVDDGDHPAVLDIELAPTLTRVLDDEVAQ